MKNTTEHIGSMNNILIGVGAGDSLTTGHNNIIIGDGIDCDPTDSFRLMYRMKDGMIITQTIDRDDYYEIRKRLCKLIPNDGIITKEVMDAMAEVCDSYVYHP